MKSVIIFHFLTSTYRRCFVFSEGLPQLFFLFSFLILNRALFTTEPENNQGFCAKDYHLFLFFVVFWSLSWSFPTTSRDHRLSLCSILRSCLRAGLFLGIIWTSTRNSSIPVLFSQCQAIRSCFRFFVKCMSDHETRPFRFFCFRNVKQFDVKRAVWFSALLDRCVCQEN